MKLKKEQIAIGNYHYTAWSFDHFLRSVQDLGLTNIEIWGAKPHSPRDSKRGIPAGDCPKDCRRRPEGGLLLPGTE